MHVGRHPGGVERRLRLQCEHLFRQVQQEPAVAVGHRPQRRPPVLGHRQLAALGRLGPRQQLLQGGVVQPAQDEHLAARQQRGVQLEGRVLGGRPDQGDGAVLDHRQEAVLLGPVEAVHLVDEQQRAAAAGPPPARQLELLLQVGDAGEHRRQRHELQVRVLGQQPGDGGLAAAGRAPQDARRQPALGQHPADRAFRAEQMVLPDDFVDPVGAQPVGERTRRLGLEEAHGPQSSPAPGW